MAKRYAVVYVGGLPQEMAVTDRLQYSGNIHRGSSSPANPVDGDLWYDTNGPTLKIHTGSGWADVTAGGSADPIIETASTVSSNTAISAGNNAFSVGPITIANNVEVTVPQNSTWLILA